MASAGLETIGLRKTIETKKFTEEQALLARPPPNKFEGATLYSINNAKCFAKNIRTKIAIASGAKQSQTQRWLFLAITQEIATALRASQ